MSQHFFDPHSLFNYLEKRANSEVKSRGKQIYNSGNVSITLTDDNRRETLFKVVSQSNFQNYVVKLKMQHGGAVFSSCTCAYDWGGLCKHEVAAIHYQLYTLMHYSAPKEKKKTKVIKLHPAPAVAKPVYDQKETVIESLAPSINQMFDWAGLGKDYRRNTNLNQILSQGTPPVKYETGERGYAKLTVNHFGTYYTTEFTVTDNRIVTSCQCDDTEYRLCIHKAAAWFALSRQFGENPLVKCKDFSNDKQELLAQYGYSLSDKDIDKTFSFSIENGELKIHSHDLGLLPIIQTSENSIISRLLPGKKPLITGLKAKNPDKSKLVFIFEGSHYSPAGNKGAHLVNFRFYPMIGKLSKKNNEIAGYLDEFNSRYFQLQNNEKELVALLENFSDESVRDISWKLAGKASAEEKELHVLNHIYNNTAKVFGPLKNEQLFAYKKMGWGKMKASELMPLSISEDKARIKAVVKSKGDLIELSFHIAIGDQTFNIEEVENYRAFVSPGKTRQFHLFDNFTDLRFAYMIGPTPELRVKKEGYENFLQTTIIPLQHHIETDVQIKGQKILKKDMATPVSKIYLEEESEVLVFKLLFDYEGTEVLPNNREELWYLENGTIISCARDVDYESSICEYLRLLHDDFAWQDLANGLYLPIDELLKNNLWFTLAEKFKSRGIEIYGFKDLKKIRQNPNLPKIEFKEGSGIDWFGLKTTVTYGSQTASLKAIHNAIIKKENFVKLDDGTLGVLPAEWLKKYSTIFQVGEVSDSEIKISKFHFSIVDELYDNIDDGAIFEELEEKRKKIKGFSEIKEIPSPKKIKAELRDYQKAGLNWMNFLHEFNFGGCLADDMGLGKTLQVISFFSHLKIKEKTKQLPHLVVVPKTLIFNWKNELEKFSSNLSAFVYSGTDRDKSMNDFKKHDIVLTTYGMVRSDIKELSAFSFNYIVLDESQAIKNPASQVSKAVKLLKGKNRMIMTGTPIENNTFDLYSQFDFANPGILGNRDFFKQQFALPIDKSGDHEAAKRLSKLIKPFILRRTKDQVAKELPDKTETVLYCEMENHQRGIYEKYKEDYKEKIMAKIAKEGINNSRLLVLEGLTKLRQICDATALILDGQPQLEGSVKLKEVMREIIENTGKHKILVFSQFLKMLALVREQLEVNGIGYEYFDGQTQNREERIKNFQEDENCRVFLISLKAGGVGLNLTEADYVYLIDPWWNPAVEQQAIDRTHRIGQTKKVFAYKLICKDTIEEKILQMQEKKKKLSDDIISAESGFVKNLNQKDIEELFS